MNWGAGTTPNGFEGGVYTDAGATNPVQTFGTSNNTIIDRTVTGLTASTQYYFRISPRESNTTVTAVCSIGTFTTTA